MDVNSFIFRLPENPGPLSSVQLSAENKEKLDTFLDEFNVREVLYNYGFSNINRLFLYGASGTGKTYLTNCLAHHLGLTLCAVNVGLILDTPTPTVFLSQIFNQVNEQGNTLLFFDECDSICWSRSDSTREDKAETQRTLEYIFQEVDRFNNTNVLVATTNLSDKIDPAFKRRFQVSMRFEKPEVKNMDEAIINFVHPDFSMSLEMDKSIKSLIQRQLANDYSISYYEIKNWVESVEKKCIQEGKRQFSIMDVYLSALRFLDMELKYEKDGQPYLFKRGVNL